MDNFDWVAERYLKFVDTTQGDKVAASILLVAEILHDSLWDGKGTNISEYVGCVSNSIDHLAKEVKKVHQSWD